MGVSLTKLFKHFLGKEEVRILMVGLDSAGKTTILYQLKFGEVVNTIPTIGFNVESVDYKNIRFNVWDVGGQQRIRSMWHHYFTNAAAVIYVVDSSDAQRMCEAAEELHSMLQRPELQEVIVLVLANKQDLPNALGTAEIVDCMNLHGIKQTWHITATCAIRGTGLYNGLDFLRDMLSQRKRLRQAYVSR